ncbi:hypothetical protein [Ensifer sp. NM-2]|nr:hypothetical protein [Ensifer sp. NM-2]
MKLKWIALALMLSALAACQSVPAERKNNCACLWQEPGYVNVLEGTAV